MRNGSRSSQYERVVQQSSYFQFPLWSDLLQVFGSLAWVAIWWDFVVLILIPSRTGTFSFVFSSFSFFFDWWKRTRPPKNVPRLAASSPRPSFYQTIYAICFAMSLTTPPDPGSWGNVPRTLYSLVHCITTPYALHLLNCFHNWNSEGRANITLHMRSI